ncbi:TetR family transcriptional regulator [Paraburkholderia monticola]|uniref:TetR family transcriptional regulator n=1 Tax=Paraburkholderia monticola TaxID=1399968 RepID=A0A149Q1P6_9BURK|nr:TetR/AcrR family transcriptional regulator [Paraburkholderia monticola]KXU91096.1 TetR family transcriptional regulator [Paraburkholderia monticola]
MGIAERKHRQKQALRERILDAARRIVVREGFDALSMRKIADAIEYSPATLYLHFASRDDIARALCAEGYAQLLATFVPLVQIADPAERLKALGRAYVAFGVEHPETYRLIFMEDPSYTGAALGGDATANPQTGDSSQAPGQTGDDPGDAALHIMIDALDELRAAGRLSASVASVEPAVWAEALWANLHGIVALNLTCPVFPSAPLDTLVGLTLDAWLGAPQSVAADASTGAVARGKEAADSTRPTPAPAGKRKAGSA